MIVWWGRGGGREGEREGEKGRGDECCAGFRV